MPFSVITAKPSKVQDEKCAEANMLYLLYFYNLHYSCF